ncbi:MAG: hypothetical protein COB23_02470 [Methylophaga sp.]|nr:MAG: hypothetical protein COB23_02470 [Methylophaga sp.]
MMSSTSNLNRLVISLFLLLIYLPANAAIKENIVWQGNYDYVAIVPTERANQPPNNHPIQLSPQDIYNLLGSIRLSDQDNSFFNLDFFSSDSEDIEQYQFDNQVAASADALFNPKELRKISVPISKAFAGLTSSQDIVFSVSGSHSGSFGKSTRTTTARIFYQDHQLHLIFGEVLVDIKKKYLRKGLSSDVPEKIEDHDLKNFRLKIGSRTEASSHIMVLRTDNMHRLNVRQRKTRTDWLIIDTALFMAAMEQHKVTEKTSHVIAEETDALQSQTQQLAQEQQKLIQKVADLEEGKVQEHEPNQTLEQRLRQLKQLHEQNVISDEIYNEKMRSLLDEL